MLRINQCNMVPFNRIPWRPQPRQEHGADRGRAEQEEEEGARPGAAHAGRGGRGGGRGRARRPTRAQQVRRARRRHVAAGSQAPGRRPTHGGAGVG